MDTRQVCMLIGLVVVVTVASKYFVNNAADKYVETIQVLNLNNKSNDR